MSVGHAREASRSQTWLATRRLQILHICWTYGLRWHDPPGTLHQPWNELEEVPLRQSILDVAFHCQTPPPCPIEPETDDETDGEEVKDGANVKRPIGQCPVLRLPSFIGKSTSAS